MNATRRLGSADQLLVGGSEPKGQITTDNGLAQDNYRRRHTSAAASPRLSHGSKHGDSDSA